MCPCWTWSATHGLHFGKMLKKWIKRKKIHFYGKNHFLSPWSFSKVPSFNCLTCFNQQILPCHNHCSNWSFSVLPKYILRLIGLLLVNKNLKIGIIIMYTILWITYFTFSNYCKFSNFHNLSWPKFPEKSVLQ